MAIVPFAQHTSQSWMQEGELVTVSGLAVQHAEYESMLWIIEEIDHRESKLILMPMDMERRSLLRIRVSAFKASPAALSISAQAPLTQTLNFQFDLPFHRKVESWIVSQLTVFKNGQAEPDIEPYLNKWIPLPDDQHGGNQILLRLCMGERERPLVMYPRLHALGFNIKMELLHECAYGEDDEFLRPCDQVRSSLSNA